MRTLATHGLAALLGALALGFASFALAAPSQGTTHPPTWPEGVYRLCNALKEVQQSLEPEEYFVYRITRCGLRGIVYGRGRRP